MHILRPVLQKDLDVFIRNDGQNSERVFRALAQYGAPMQGVSPSDFEGQPHQMFQIGIDPVRVDILQGIPGVSFDEVWQNSLSSELDGIPVRIISRDHLIQNKLAAGRPRDLGDVDELRKFARES